MEHKTNHSQWFLFILCFLGSIVVAVLLTVMLNLVLPLSVVVFAVVLLFLYRLVYTGNIRTITCKEEFLVIQYQKAKEVSYKDISAVYVVADMPHQVNAFYSTRDMTIYIVLNKQSIIHVPYDSFKTSIYTIIKTIEKKNPSVKTDPIVKCEASEFHQAIEDIHKCRIKASTYLNNPYTKR